MGSVIADGRFMDASRCFPEGCGSKKFELRQSQSGGVSWTMEAHNDNRGNYRTWEDKADAREASSAQWATHWHQVSTLNTYLY